MHIALAASSAVRFYAYDEWLGMIWMWSGVREEADLSSLPTTSLIDEVGVDGVPLKMNWYCIVPYGFEALIENVLCPVHVHWAHHGTRSFFRRERGAKKTANAVNLLGERGINSGGLHWHAPMTCVYAHDILPYLDVMFAVTPISRYTSWLFMIDINKPAPPLPLLQRVGGRTYPTS